MKRETKVWIGAISFAGWRALGGVAWGSAFATGDTTARVLLGAVGVLFTVDHVMRLFVGARPKEPETTTAETLAASLNGAPLDAEETAELAAFLRRAHERRQRVTGPRGPVN